MPAIPATSATTMRGKCDDLMFVVGVSEAAGAALGADGSNEDRKLARRSPLANVLPNAMHTCAWPGSLRG
jgi:hypothetical protein